MERSYWGTGRWGWRSICQARRRSGWRSPPARRAGIEFQNGEQLKLLAGEDEIRVDAEALPRLGRPLL